MNTQEFINKLESLPNQSLIFDYGSGQIKPGYHVTEVMNVTYESMDCGGQANFWRETIIQLMGPSIKDKPEYMTIEKFLSIYKKVAASVSVRPESEIRFEYGDAYMPAIHYHLDYIEEREDAVVIHFAMPGVTCKAADRKIDAATCCTPVSNVISNVVWGDSAPPKGGCC